MKKQFDQKTRNINDMEENKLNKSGNASQEAHKHKGNKTLGQEKDDFDYATSWKRAFSSLYTRFCWLKSFA